MRPKPKSKTQPLKRSNQISDTTLRRRFLSYLRSNGIPHTYSNGIFNIGSSVSHICAGRWYVYFPKATFKETGNISFNISLHDIYRAYLRYLELSAVIVARYQFSSDSAHMPLLLSMVSENYKTEIECKKIV